MDDTGHIRPVRPEDWPAVEDIVRRIWAIGLSYVREQRYGFEIGGKPWYEHKTPGVRAELYEAADASFVTEFDGQVIGFCCLHIDQATGIGEVGQNGVHPDFRGRGYGARQLAFVLEELRRRGVEIVEVQTALNEGHAPARRMYERAGFEPIIDYRVYTLRLDDDVARRRPMSGENT
jgi:GNAT superfamily N-acetyltransferase